MKTETIVTHTPTPWHLNVNSAWSDATKDRGPVFVCTMVTGTHVLEDQNEANAAYIVRAVNSHERLLNLLKQMQSANVFKGIWIQFVEEAIAKAEEHVARWG